MTCPEFKELTGKPLAASSQEEKDLASEHFGQCPHCRGWLELQWTKYVIQECKIFGPT